MTKEGYQRQEAEIKSIANGIEGNFSATCRLMLARCEHACSDESIFTQLLNSAQDKTPEQIFRDWLHLELRHSGKKELDQFAKIKVLSMLALDNYLPGLQPQITHDEMNQKLSQKNQELRGQGKDVSHLPSFGFVVGKHLEEPPYLEMFSWMILATDPRLLNNIHPKAYSWQELSMTERQEVSQWYADYQRDNGLRASV